jgi:hypothetical protein
MSKDNEWIKLKSCKAGYKFYMKLFSNNQINREWLQTAITYPTLEQEERNRLAAPVSQDEVKNAMFGMHPWMEGSRAEWIPGGVL